jgi:large subunit ribosomal protein L9
MEVILRDHVDHVGKRGDVVKVADGYARNYLLPRKLALPATDANKNWIARERKISEAREGEERVAAEALAERLVSLDLQIARKVGDNDTKVDRRKILLPDPLRALGETLVPVKLHRDVTAQLKVTITKEA